MHLQNFRKGKPFSGIFFRFQPSFSGRLVSQVRILAPKRRNRFGESQGHHSHKLSACWCDVGLCGHESYLASQKASRTKTRMR